ncbi:MAG: hypothetical protein Q8N15_00365 [Bacillota bacterium]|nr:hypothetical protein [Bacillota bacterium]
MSMKTIEQLMKPVILADLQYLINLIPATEQPELKLTNDLRHAEATDTEKTIAALMMTGRPVRSNQAVHAINVPLTMMFRVSSGRLQKLLRLLNQYCVATNTYKSTVIDQREDESTELPITYQYRLFWDGPTPTGAVYPVRVAVFNNTAIKSDSADMQLVIMTGSITYTKDLALDEESRFLRVPLDAEGKYASTNGTLNYVEIAGVGEVSGEIAAALDATSLVEEFKASMAVAGDSEGFSIQFVRIAGNPAHDMIMDLWYKARAIGTMRMQMKFTNSELVKTEYRDVIVTNVKKIERGGFLYVTVSGMVE